MRLRKHSIRRDQAAFSSSRGNNRPCGRAGLPGSDITLGDISTWADKVRSRSRRLTTGPWHYVNIPREPSGYNAQRDRARGCIASAIERSLRLLRHPAQDRAVRQEALKWIVHLVADLHQPLHAIGDDKGGNDVVLQFFGRQTSLHRL